MYALSGKMPGCLPGIETFLPVVLCGHMARSAAQVFGHLPGVLQQLLGIAHHLRVSAQHHMTGFFIHWQPDRFSSSPLSISAGTRPVSESATVSRLTTVWMRNLPS